MDERVRIFTERAERFGELLGGVGDRWQAATPCEGWTVADVVGHVVSSERDFLTQRGIDPGPATAGGDPLATWNAHIAAVSEALGRDGVADAEYDGHFGRTTVGDTLVEFYGFDLVIHGWDVAVATGQPWTIADEEIVRLNADADGWGPALRMPGVCGPEVPVADDATAQDRLLGRLGRDPSWDPRATH